MRRSFLIGLALLCASANTDGVRKVEAADDARTLTLIVMDPLAAPLSCPCVKGYAQRDYAKLGDYLKRELDRPVQVVFQDSLTSALTKTSGQADIIIGKRSVVVAEAASEKVGLKPSLTLSGKDGVATQTGLIVVPAKDPAQQVSDLNNYRIIFGPRECDEKYSAAFDLLKTNGVTFPTKIETCAACSDGATTILELGPDVRAATVISSYAAPLLEGCGTIEKGDLRVVGRTNPVPFIVVFLSDKLPAVEQNAIEKALRGVADEPLLLHALESKSGFVPESEPKEKTPNLKPLAGTQKKSL